MTVTPSNLLIADKLAMPMPPPTHLSSSVALTSMGCPSLEVGMAEPGGGRVVALAQEKTGDSHYDHGSRNADPFAGAALGLGWCHVPMAHAGAVASVLSTPSQSNALALCGSAMF